MSGSSGYNFVPVAEKCREFYSCGKRDDSADVSFRRTYDLSVVASDYVCKLYAISLSDILGNRPIFSKQKKSGLLIGGTFLMIMTSFYFSIGGILALGLYGIYRYARTKERAEEMITVKGFLGDGLRFAGRILTAIMLAGVLLVPTAMALLGRSGSKGEKTDIWQLLTPQINLEKFLYGASMDRDLAV